MKRWRIIIVVLVFFLGVAAIISRLLYIQIVQHGYYKALAKGQESSYAQMIGERGRIFLNGGEPLALNVKEKYVSLAIDKLENKEAVIKSISPIIKMSEKEISDAIKDSKSEVELKAGLTDEEYNELKKLNIAGLEVSERLIRRYPQETMASQIVGFVGGEGAGQYGLEGYYEDTLKGKDTIQANNFFSGSYNGSDIYLTIDYNVQLIAERALEEAKKGLNIEGGQIIVMDPATGKILAEANYPNFNPNQYSKEKSFNVFQNSAVQKLFEPGSIFKPITMAAAIDQGKITPATTYVDSGSVSIGKWTIYNFGKRSYGEKTMTEVLENSINTGAVFAEKQLGNDLFLAYVKKFGFFEPTGIDLQEEVFSQNTELKKGYEVNYMTAAFGQGIETTPIQMLKAYSAIANNGRMVKPYIVEKIVSDGKTTNISPQVAKEQVINSKTAAEVTGMMVSVIENGFAKKAKVPGYYIAGKTGTAQISYSSINVNKTGYSDKTWQSFVGFAPAYNPRFIILIKLDNPAASTAEYSSVPIFRSIAKDILDYLEVPPDYEEKL
ncbi:MAG: penicillin-binding protein 2 [Candidatus Nealsonbacteria bacterium]|nr:penicillin-binding protein 2 [Candidatus Nealsonbacteria bacterium]